MRGDHVVEMFQLFCEVAAATPESPVMVILDCDRNYISSFKGTLNTF